MIGAAHPRDQCHSQTSAHHVSLFLQFSLFQGFNYCIHHQHHRFFHMVPYIQDASVDKVTVHMRKPDEKAGNLIQFEEQLPCIQHWGYNMDKIAIPMLIFSSCFFSFGSRICCVHNPALQPWGLPNLKIRATCFFQNPELLCITQFVLHNILIRDSYLCILPYITELCNV